MLQTGTLAFLAGILFFQTRAVLPPAWWLFLLPVVIGGLFLFRQRGLKLACCLMGGFLLAQFQANTLLQERQPAALTHHHLHVRGFVTSLPVKQGERTRFEFEITDVSSPRLKHYPHKVILSWYGKKHKPLRPGDQWQLNLRLRTPHNFMNPGSFDYSAWLLQRGVVATGYVYNKGNNRLLNRSSWRYPIQSLRFKCQVFLRTNLAGAPAVGLITALLIGDRSGISKAQWRILQQTGTVHLMAISGLHIGLIAGFVFFIVMQVWRRLPRVCLLLPAPKAAALIAWLAALLYAALAGFAIPTQRALIMLAVILLSVYLQRNHKPSQVISLALLLVLFRDPFAVLSASFWLSFGAVAWIYYLLQIQPQHRNRIVHWWRMQLAISLGLLPLVIVFFQQAPLLSPLTNLVAIPWVSLLVLPLAMFSMLNALWSQHVAVWGLQMAAQLMQLLQHGLAWAASLNWNLVYLPTPHLFSLILAVTGVALLLLPRALPARYLGAILCLPVFFASAHRPAAGSIRLTLLDVGQGLATVVQTTRHTLVFDTGPRYSANLDAGTAVILPFLHRAHVDAIDTLVISHSDIDHRGGMQSLLHTIPVTRIISSVPHLRTNMRSNACVAGRRWHWDGVKFQILYPSRSEKADASTDNNRSCVIQISTKAHHVLLTGDIEAPAEADLVRDYGKKLHSDVLVIPHHGSKTSSTPAFLDAVKPKLALISAGWHNRFGLPAGSVLRRLQARGLLVLNTASSGAIGIDVAQKLQIHRYRQAYRRYWQVW